METLGSLCDKLTIEIIRQEKIRDSHPEKVEAVQTKIDRMKNEINEYLWLAINNKVELEEPKLKYYKNEQPSSDELLNISDAISRLSVANYTLWNLEDKRRDLSLEDSIRLRAADDVGKWNRVRNDAIDKINELLSKQIKSR